MIYCCLSLIRNISSEPKSQPEAQAPGPGNIGLVLEWGGLYAEWGGPDAEWGGLYAEWEGQYAEWGGLFLEWEARTQSGEARTQSGARAQCGEAPTQSGSGRCNSNGQVVSKSCSFSLENNNICTPAFGFKFGIFLRFITLKYAPPFSKMRILASFTRHKQQQSTNYKYHPCIRKYSSYKSV